MAVTARRCGAFMNRRKVVKFPGHRCRGSNAQYAALPAKQKRIVDAFNRAFGIEECAQRFDLPVKVRS